LDLKVVNLPPDGLQLKFENYQKKIEENYQGVDTRALLNYEIHYRQIDEVTFKKENVTKYGGRDACGNDEWKIDDHSPTQPTQVAAGKYFYISISEFCGVFSALRHSVYDSVLLLPFL
jgi:hypothetical protein